MVRDFKGKSSDYDELNQFIDSSKLYFPNQLHRMFTHNSFFINVCEKVFGMYLVNSDGKEIPIRRLCEEHIKQDHNGFIPTMQDWVKELDCKIPSSKSWVRTPRKKDLDYLTEYYNK